MENNLDDFLTPGELKGINTPVKLTEVGKLFFQHSDFNQFVKVQSGYLLKSALTYLIYYYCHKNQLVVGNMITPDQFMIDTFGNLFDQIHIKYNQFNVNEFENYYIQTLSSLMCEKYERRNMNI